MNRSAFGLLFAWLMICQSSASEAADRPTTPLWTTWQRHEGIRPDSNAPLNHAVVALGLQHLQNELSVAVRGAADQPAKSSERRVSGEVGFWSWPIQSSRATLRFTSPTTQEQYLDSVSDFREQFEERAQLPGARTDISRSASHTIFFWERNWQARKKEEFVRQIGDVHVTLRRTVRDESGKPTMVDRHEKSAWYIRSEDALLIEGNTPHVLQLPSHFFERPKELQEDLFTIACRPMDIPESVRNSFWQAASAVLQTQMQVRDNETSSQHQRRRELVRLQHDALQSVMFSVDEAWASVGTDAEGKSYRGRAKLRLRPDSAAGEFVKQIRPAASILPSIDGPNDVFRFHWCSTLPPRIRNALQTLTKTTTETLHEHDLQRTAKTTLESGVAELAAHIRFGEDHGFVTLAAIRAPGADDRIDRTLHALLEKNPDIDVRWQDDGQQRQYVKIALRSVPKQQQWLPARFRFVQPPEFIYLRSLEDVIFIAAGADSCWQALADQFDRIEADPQPSHGLKPAICRAELTLDAATWADDVPSPLAAALVRLEQQEAKWSRAKAEETLAFLGRQLSTKPNDEQTSALLVTRPALEHRPASARLAVYSQSNNLQIDLRLDESLALLYWGRLAMNAVQNAPSLQQRTASFRQTPADLIIKEEARRFKSQNRSSD